MNHFLNGVARAAAETFNLPDPILEVGSYQVQGQQEVSDLRGLFAGRSYLGVDARAGPGVDLVADVERLPQADRSVGTVIAMSTFEHVKRFWRGFEEVHRILRPDGVLLVSCPFYFRIHCYPSDYWRFTPEALEVLLADYPTRILGWHGPHRRPANVWALAFGDDYPPVTPAQHDHYRRLLAQYAHEPLSRSRSLRYRLASWICGRRPVASYLQQNCWETVLRVERGRPAPPRKFLSHRRESVCSNRNEN